MSKIAVIGIVGNSVFLPVERFHVGGETVEASDIHFEPGGKGFNQAVAAARFGAEVAFLGAVGADFFESADSFLKNEGIKACLALKKDKKTAFAAIVTEAGGANRVTVYQGAELTAEDARGFADEIKSADILLLNNEVPEAVNLEAVRIAKAAGVFVILNPAPARETEQYILDTVDLFTPNEHETLGLEGKKNVIVTLGKRGSLDSESGEIIPPFNFGSAADTTGAGDTYSGVLSAALAEGSDRREAIRLATAASSLGVTRKYAVSSIPTRREILEKLQK